jgi:Rod binding domain-containing protein
MDAISAMLAAGVAPARGTAGPGAQRSAPVDDAKAAKEVESLFAFQLLKAMRRTVPEDGIMSGGKGEEIAHTLQDEALSKAIAEAGGLGLARHLLPALERAQGGAPDGSAGGDAPNGTL